MIKKVLLPLLLFLLFTSCTSLSEADYIRTAQDKQTIEDVIGVYTKASKRLPKNLHLLYNKAYYQTVDKRYSDALKTTEKALKLESKALSFYLLRAHIFKAQGQAILYEMELKALLKQDPLYKEAEYELLNFYLDTNNDKAAIKTARSLYNKDITDKEALKALARLEGGVYKTLAKVEDKKVYQRKRKETLEAPVLYDNLSINDLVAYFPTVQSSFLSR